MHLNRLLDLLEQFDPGFKLPDIIDMPVIPSFLGVQAGQSLNHLTVHVQEFYNFNTLDKKTLETALNSIGSVLTEKGYYFKTRAGWLNANPAVILVSADGEPLIKCLKVICFAKEGLINQKTATKAIKRFETALKNQRSEFFVKTIIPLNRLGTTVL